MMIGQEHVQINSRIPDGFNIDHFNECFILMHIMDMHIMYIHCQRPKALLKLGSLSSQSDPEITTKMTTWKIQILMINSMFSA